MDAIDTLLLSMMRGLYFAYISLRIILYQPVPAKWLSDI